MKVRILKKLLSKAGFRYKRQAKGDHEVWENEEGRRFSIDGAAGREIPLGTLKAYFKQAGLQLEVKSKKRK